MVPSNLGSLAKLFQSDTNTHLLHDVSSYKVWSLEQHQYSLGAGKYTFLGAPLGLLIPELWAQGPASPQEDSDTCSNLRIPV